MINIENLSIAFENRIILNNINLNIDKGETLVLMGKNGSGKSVLLKCVAGLIDYSGSIYINNTIIPVRSELRKNNLNAPSLSYVFQKGGLFDSMNVFENTAFPLKRLGKSESEISESVLSALGRVGLSGNEQKLPSELSGGMQKRVGLARAICSYPDIILYDDPTAGLDPILSDSITDVICDIRGKNNTTSIIVTHDLTAAKKVADKIALLYNSELVFSGSSNDFFTGNNPYTVQFIEGNLEGPIDIF
ncbi:MAG: ATP-binding cassette domain-containing protein [Spirochaetes bacterium]|nr:ATP-binding cassette domain-containing protein [Spirochaetota bacterium]